jgi:hypothetical protein
MIHLIRRFNIEAWCRSDCFELPANFGVIFRNSEYPRHKIAEQLIDCLNAL